MESRVAYSYPHLAQHRDPTTTPSHYLTINNILGPIVYMITMDGMHALNICQTWG